MNVMKVMSILKNAAYALVASFFVVSCSDEISSMKPEDATGTVKIQGQLFYSRGYQTSSDLTSVSKISNQPVPNKTVFIEVPNSSYKDGSTGVQRFTTQSDVNGFYNITIPIVAEGCQVTIKTEDFVSKYSEPKFNPVNFLYNIETIDRSFKVSPIVVPVSNQAIYIRNLEYLPEIID